jgi:hypothetical protein
MDETILKLTEELMSIKDELSKVSLLKTELEEKKKKAEYALFNEMETCDIHSFKHDVYGTVYKSHRIFCKIIDIDKACNFFKEKGVYDDIMKLKPTLARLNKLMQTEYIDKIEPVPELEIGVQATLVPMIGNRGNKKLGGGDADNSMSSEEVAY